MRPYSAAKFEGGDPAFRCLRVFATTCSEAEQALS